MNAEPYVPGWNAWMLSLPQWMRRFIARSWRHSSDRSAAQAETALVNAMLYRSEANRLEAGAEWIEGEQ